MEARYTLESELKPADKAGRDLLSILTNLVMGMMIGAAWIAVVWVGKLQVLDWWMLALVLAVAALGVFVALCYTANDQNDKARAALAISNFGIFAVCCVFFPTKNRLWMINDQVYLHVPIVAIPFWSTVSPISVRTKTEEHRNFDTFIQIDNRMSIHAMWEVNLRHVPTTVESARRMARGGDWEHMDELIVQVIGEELERCLVDRVTVDKGSLYVGLKALDAVRKKFTDVEISGTIRLRDVEAMLGSTISGAAITAAPFLSVGLVKCPDLSLSGCEC